MRERNRRSLCRMLFVAVCVVPTLIVTSWAALRASPMYAYWQHNAWEQTLFQVTGLVTQIERVEFPAPESTLLVNVKLTDPDGGDVVATLRQAEIVRTPDGTLVVLSQPEIAQGKFLRLWDTLHQRVLRGRLPDSTLQIMAGEMTLDIGQHAQSFTAVRCTVEPRETGVRTLIDFQLAGGETATPAQLQIERNRQTVPPTTRWQLHTAAPIPCGLFTDYLLSLERLGPQCTFQGDIVMAELAGVWSGQFAGQFSRVDMDHVTDAFPHKLSGEAHVQVYSAAVRHGVLVEAAGHVGCLGGAVSTTLLESLAEHLQLRLPPPAIRLPRPYASYDEMAFDFSLSAEGITLTGQCQGNSPGTILHSSDGPLLVGDPQRSYPLVSMVRSLSPASDVQVPATEETQRLLGVLAFPTLRESAAAVAERPRARLRPTPPK